MVRTTHYFFTFTRTVEEARTHNNDDEMRSILTGIFAGEDSPMLGAMQQRMGNDNLRLLKSASLPGDAGAVRVRRALEKLIAAERASASQEPLNSTAEASC